MADSPRALIVGADAIVLTCPLDVFAGRLANYVYIDMDDCMRQALDTAEGEVLPALAKASRP